MFIIALISLLSQDSHACINGMFGAKQISFRGFQKDKKVQQIIRRSLPFIYECMIEHSPKELTDVMEYINVSISFKEGAINKLRLRSSNRSDLKKEITCLKTLFQKSRYRIRTDRNLIRGGFRFKHNKTDKEAFVNMLPENLNGTYLSDDESLKVTRQGSGIEYHYRYQSPKGKCTYSYSGVAKIYPVAQVFDEDGCRNTLTIGRDQIIFKASASCENIPDCFTPSIEGSILKKSSR